MGFKSQIAQDLQHFWNMPQVFWAGSASFLVFLSIVLCLIVAGDRPAHPNETCQRFAYGVVREGVVAEIMPQHISVPKFLNCYFDCCLALRFFLSQWAVDWIAVEWLPLVSSRKAMQPFNLHTQLRIMTTPTHCKLHFEKLQNLRKISRKSFLLHQWRLWGNLPKRSENVSVKARTATCSAGCGQRSTHRHTPWHCEWEWFLVFLTERICTWGSASKRLCNRLAAKKHDATLKNSEQKIRENTYQKHSTKTPSLKNPKWTAEPDNTPSCTLRDQIPKW